MWRPSPASCSAFCVRVYFGYGRHAARLSLQCSLHKNLRRVRERASAAACTWSCRRLQVGARLSNRSDGRAPSDLFRENTNLEWMVLATRKRTPPVDSIFRAELRVRSDPAATASAPRAAKRLRRSRPPRLRELSTRSGTGLAPSTSRPYRAASIVIDMWPQTQSTATATRAKTHSLALVPCFLTSHSFQFVWNVKKYGAARVCLRDWAATTKPSRSVRREGFECAFDFKSVIDIIILMYKMCDQKLTIKLWIS